jgi:hypothetical protein
VADDRLPPPTSPEPPEIRSACHLGRFPTRSGPGWALVGQDGGQSIPLPAGRLFVFADTLLTAARPVPGSAPPPARRPPGYGRHGHLGILANTAARAESADLEEALAGLDYFLDDRQAPREILPSSADERREGIRFWPQHGLLVNGSVYLFYLGVRAVTGATWGFVSEGTGLAELDPATGECRRLDQDGDWVFWPPRTDDLHFGVQVLQEGELAYVFASRRRGLRVTAQLARVEVGRLSQPGAYDYLASEAPRWTRRPSESCDLGPSGSQFSVSWNRHLRQYLMTYVDLLDGGLYLRVADAPWGPYGDPRRVAGVPRQKEAYLGFEHASFASEEGRRILISYCEPRFCQSSLLAVRLA